MSRSYGNFYSLVGVHCTGIGAVDALLPPARLDLRNDNGMHAPRLLPAVYRHCAACGGIMPTHSTESYERDYAQDLCPDCYTYRVELGWGCVVCDHVNATHGGTVDMPCDMCGTVVRAICYDCASMHETTCADCQPLWDALDSATNRWWPTLLLEAVNP